MILRLPVETRLFNERGEVVQTIRSTKKSQVRLRLHDLPRGEWSFGICRVWYSKTDDFWNEFRFTTFSELDENLTATTEKPLITFLKDVIPPKYLEKRRMSPAQRQAILKARNNSPMGIV